MALISCVALSHGKDLLIRPSANEMKCAKYKEEKLPTPQYHVY
jgi:hypothetical protein